MSNSVIGETFPAVPLLLVFGLVACSGQAAEGESGVAAVVHPVQWTGEYSMPDLLDEPSSVSSHEGLRNLLGQRWYADIEVVKADGEPPEMVTSCNDYFSLEGKKLHVQNVQERQAFLELIVMCEATQWFVEASASARSGIPAKPLTEDLPEHLPKSLALVTSEAEFQRIMKNPAITNWGEVNDITRMTPESEHRVVYHLEAGQQSVALIGRGDFNRDGTEDILVSVQDTVNGGSYYDLRLFVLSVTEPGKWVVEAQYPSP